jgi:hypothetical protein
LAGVAAAGEAFGAEPVAVVAPTVQGGGKKAKRGSGGVVGTIVGGLLSIPLVFLILLGVLWGTGRDPLNLRAQLPAFLLPKRSVALTSSSGPAIDPSLTLDTLTTTEYPVPVTEPAPDDADAASAPDASDLAATGDAPAPEEAPVPDDTESPPITDPVPMAIETPAVAIPEPEVAVVPQPEPPVIDPVPIPVPAPVAAPPEPAPLEPAPLDLSGVETAVAKAIEALESVPADTGDNGPDRRRALVAWYQTLARVGEQLALLETSAADTGRPLEETPAAIRELSGRIASAKNIDADLERLCRNWVDFARRPADGVLLVGELGSVRQVGPFWHAAVGLKQSDGSVRQVTVISRREPRAGAGDRVGVIGVVFSGDVVWAADCGRWEAAVQADPF